MNRDLELLGNILTIIDYEGCSPAIAKLLEENNNKWKQKLGEFKR